MSKYVDYNGLLYFWTKIKAKLANKVDKVSGKGLSTNDYTTIEKNKLSGLSNYSHPTSGVTAGSYGDDGATRTLANGGKFTIPVVTVDANGHTTGASEIVLTLPAGYSLPTASSTAIGGVKIGSGLSISSGVASVASAPKLATARAIALTGDVTGSANFDGSAGISITATVADNSHAHTVANVTGLQTALDAKLSSTLADATYAKKADITTVFRYKGSVPTVSDLPETATTGDTYNVEARGVNYTWNGTTWDALGELFEVQTVSNGEIDTILAS